MAASSTYAAKWAFDAAGATFGGSSPQFALTGDTLQKVAPLLIGTGLRGYRARQAVQTRAAPYTVQGTLSFQPSPQTLSYTLLWAMGGGSSTAPAFADALALRDALVYRVDGTYKYTSLAINRWTLTGRSGQLLELTLDVVGKTMTTGTSYTSAALGTNLSYEPLQHADVTTSSTDGYACEDFSLTIDNQVAPKFRNSLTATDLVSAGRSVRFTAGVPAADTGGGSVLALGSTVDTAATLTLTNSTVSAAFTFANARYTQKTPLPQGDEFIYSLDADILGSSNGNEFTCAIDLTP